MIPSIIFSLLFIVLAIIFMMGKGDNLIAGYNTASEEERKEVNIKRLRIVMTILMVITADYCIILPFIGNNKNAQLAAAGTFFAITIVGVIIANTWAKKKR